MRVLPDACERGLRAPLSFVPAWQDDRLAGPRESG